jgi:glutaconyl-CoA/methylmalonyl-CoA decarboxylase subunit gamma
MKYFVAIAGRTLEVVVAGEQVLVDGRPFAAHLSPVPGTPLRHLLLGNASFTLAMESSGRGEWAVGFHGLRHRVQVIDERTRHIRSLTGDRAGGSGQGVLRAPMPGLVIRVQVVVGQAVAAGQAVVALEAMKMENELRAPGTGVVRAVAVEPGQAVEKGAILVEFTSES